MIDLWCENCGHNFISEHHGGIGQCPSCKSDRIHRGGNASLYEQALNIVESRIEQLEAENAKLKERLASSIRSAEIFENCVDQISPHLKGIEDEFVHFPEAVKNIVTDNAELKERLAQLQALVHELYREAEEIHGIRLDPNTDDGKVKCCE